MKISQFCWVLALIVAASGTALAQNRDQNRKTLSYLQSEPTTLFDLGMKRLRGAALNTASRMIDKGGTSITSSVSYNHEEGIIDIQFNLKESKPIGADALHKSCLQSRKSLILRMFSIGPTEFSSQVPVNERIRRRIGAQFAHEPVDTSQGVLSMAKRLEPIIYFTVNLAADNPSFNISCRGLAVDLMEE